MRWESQGEEGRIHEVGESGGGRQKYMRWESQGEEGIIHEVGESGGGRQNT